MTTSAVLAPEPQRLSLEPGWTFRDLRSDRGVAKDNDRSRSARGADRRVALGVGHGSVVQDGQGPAPAGQFAGDRDDRLLLPGGEYLPAVMQPVVALLSTGPGRRRRLVPAGLHGQGGAVRLAVVPGRFHEQPAGVSVPGLGDRPLRTFRTGGELGGPNPR